MKKKIFDFGKIDYNRSSRRNCRVTVEIRLCDQDEGPGFTASAAIWNPRGTDCYCGGQCLDEVAKFIHDPTFIKIYNIWKRWHLNAARSGTQKQEAEIREFLENNKFGYDYKLVCQHLEDLGLLVDNGHRYGSAWLYEEIPADVLQEINNLLD